MPWKEATPMSERKAFVGEALKAEASVSALCREFGISRKTGYKWLKRYREARLKDETGAAVQHTMI